MNSIGGNVTAYFQLKRNTGTNPIGEKISEWVTIQEKEGFLDLSNGDSKYTNYNSKIQESTHLFFCDYFPIDFNPHDSRLLIDGNTYDIKLIDDPMGMHEHYEIYLQFTGVMLHG